MKLFTILFIILTIVVGTHTANSKHSYSSQITQQGNYLNAYVLDWDTIRLTSGETIRLVGINAPELSHNNSKDMECWADISRDYLIHILSQIRSDEIEISRLGVDKYNRALAIIYLGFKRENLNRKLVQEGFAEAYIPEDAVKGTPDYYTDWYTAVKTRKGIYSKEHQCWYNF